MSIMILSGWAAICALAMSIFAVFSGSLRSSMVWFRALSRGRREVSDDRIEGCGKVPPSRREEARPAARGGDGPFACSLVSSTGGASNAFAGRTCSSVETSRAARRDVTPSAETGDGFDPPGVQDSVGPVGRTLCSTFG